MTTTCHSHSDCPTGYCQTGSCSKPGPYDPCKPGQCPANYFCAGDGGKLHCRHVHDQTPSISSSSSSNDDNKNEVTDLIIPIIGAILLVAVLLFVFAILRKWKRRRQAAAAKAAQVAYTAYPTMPPPLVTYPSTYPANYQNYDVAQPHVVPIQEESQQNTESSPSS